MVGLLGWRTRQDSAGRMRLSFGPRPEPLDTVPLSWSRTLCAGCFDQNARHGKARRSTKNRAFPASCDVRQTDVIPPGTGDGKSGCRFVGGPTGQEQVGWVGWV